MTRQRTTPDPGAMIQEAAEDSQPLSPSAEGASDESLLKKPSAGSSAWLLKGYNQVIITGVVAFCCPGFFNALQGLGGAGSANASANDAANAALYLCFAASGYFGGMFFNLFGPRILMAAGGLCYGLYACAAYLSGHDASLNWLFVLSGAVLGLGAGLFWTAQGALMMAYAPSDRKGHYIGLFWLLFNLGGFIGGMLQFALNFSASTSPDGGASPLAYFCFMGVMLSGSVMAALLIRNPLSVMKEDLSPVEISRAKGVAEEFRAVLSVAADRNMILLAILFLGSNFYYTYVFNCFNGVRFNIRTRGLNSAIYWLSQMAGAVGFGRMLDDSSLSLKQRGSQGFWLLVILFFVSYGTGFYIQRHYEGGYERGEAKLQAPDFLIDFWSVRWPIPTAVLLLYGISESCLQAYAYWIMGALGGNDTNLCAKYTGFYKSIQSLGAAGAWLLDLDQFHVSYTAQLLAGWGLFVLGLGPLWLAVKSLREGRVLSAEC